MNPTDVEFEPNPVILPHLQGQYRDESDNEANLHQDFDDTDAGRQYAYRDANVSSDLIHDEAGTSLYQAYVSEEDAASSTEDILTPTSDNGPVTMAANLSAFPCSECGLTFKKAYKRKCQPGT